MKIIVTDLGTFGPYNQVETLADRWIADGIDMQFSVVGTGTAQSIDNYVPVPSQEEAQAMRAGLLATVCQHAEDLIEALVDSYPVNERLTFSKQLVEASAWTANKTAATPFIDANAAQSGVDKATIVTNILAKSDEFSTYTGTVVGYKQKLAALLDGLADDQLADFDPLAGWPALSF